MCTTGINDTGDKFAADVNYTGGKFLELRISLRIFEKNRNGPNGILIKIPEVEILVALSLCPFNRTGYQTGLNPADSFMFVKICRRLSPRANATIAAFWPRTVGSNHGFVTKD
jgi:hypothetical protein